MSLRVVLGASVASHYGNGGMAWERLSWALGLKELGVQVVMVDQLDRNRCVHRQGENSGYERCLNGEYFDDVIGTFGLSGSAALLGEGGEELSGLGLEAVCDFAAGADLLVNHAGDLRLDVVKRRPRRRAYLDADPGFTQLSVRARRPMPRFEGHDLHFTIGENVGEPECPLPTSGIRWLHTRQPALLSEWPFTDTAAGPAFSTLGRWRGVGPHGPLEEIGLSFATKADELEKVIELPRRSGQAFEIALDPRSADGARELLVTHGWGVVDGRVVSFDPDGFRRYVQRSWAEFSVAKGVYVATRTGWFSDRTVRYLSSGRPALVQDTGFGRVLPVGEGLLAFRTLDDAVRGIERIVEDYDAHRAAARRIAEEHFDSRLVLTRFLEDALS